MAIPGLPPPTIKLEYKDDAPSNKLKDVINSSPKYYDINGKGLKPLSKKEMEYFLYIYRNMGDGYKVLIRDFPLQIREVVQSLIKRGIVKKDGRFGLLVDQGIRQMLERR